MGRRLLFPNSGFPGFLRIPIILTELWSEKFEWFDPSPIEPFNSDEDRVQEGARDAELRLSLRGRRGGKKDYAPHEGRADLERATAAQLIGWTRATNLTQNGYGWH